MFSFIEFLTISTSVTFYTLSQDCILQEFLMLKGPIIMYSVNPNHSVK